MNAERDPDPDPTPAEWRLRSPHSHLWDQADDYEWEGGEPELDLPPLTTHTATTSYSHPHSGRTKTRTIYTNRPQPTGTCSLRRHPMYDPSSDSDIDRRQVEALDEAEAVLDRFMPNGHIRHEVSFDAVVHDYCEASRPPLDYSDDDDRQVGVRDLQHVLKERCVASQLRLAEVYLDTEGVQPNPRKRWMETDINKIVFTQLISADRLLNRHTDNKRFVAIYWSAEDAPLVYRPDKFTGELTARRNGFAAEAYMGICAVYESLHEAEEAAQELQHAVDVIARYRTGTAEEDDPIRTLDTQVVRAKPSSM